MDAKEARSKAQNFNTSANNGEFDRVLNKIKKAVNVGKYEIYIYDVIKDDVRNKLTEMGYLVGNTEFDRNESLTKISW